MSKRKPTEAQIWLADYLREHLPKQGWPAQWVETEYRFCEGRKWEFDVAIPNLNLAFECDGGKWHGGHRRGKALEADYEQQNTAILMGWRLIRWTNEQILSGEAKEFFEDWFQRRGMWNRQRRA